MSACLRFWANTTGLLLLLNSSTVFADAKLPPPIGNSLVLQSDHALTVRGWANPGLKGRNGVVWSRKEIDMHPPAVHQSGRLRLGNVVDRDLANLCDEEGLPASLFETAQTA